MSDTPNVGDDAGSSPPRTGAARTSTARISSVRARRRLTAATGIVFGLVPVLWIVELTGPEWLNMALRALWVVLALGAVAFGLRDIAAGRRGQRAAGRQGQRAAGTRR